MVKKLLINGLVVCAAVGLGVRASQKPWQVYQKQSGEAKSRVEQMKTAENHRDQLLRAEAREQSSIGREEKAREAGYLGPDEVASNIDAK